MSAAHKFVFLFFLKYPKIYFLKIIYEPQSGERIGYSFQKQINYPYKCPPPRILLIHQGNTQIGKKLVNCSYFSSFLFLFYFKMEMKKFACAVLVIAASMSVALAHVDHEAPAPAPASDATVALPTLGSLLGASLVSIIALYRH